MVIPKIAHLRKLDPAALLNIGASWMKGTPLGFVGRVRNGARDRVQGLPFPCPARQGCQKSHSVGMAGITKDLVHGADFCEDTGIHDMDPVRNFGYHAQVMGDIQKGHMPFFLELSEEMEYLVLNGDIEGCRRFIGNNEVGLARKGHGDHDTLPLPPAEVVGIIAHALFR